MANPDPRLTTLVTLYREAEEAYKERKSSLHEYLRNRLDAGELTEYAATQRTGLSRQTIRRINGKHVS